MSTTSDKDTIIALEARLREANERIEELEGALVDDARAKVQLEQMMLENGELNIRARGNIFHVFCDAFARTFEHNQATNYLVAEFSHDKLGDFSVTMQRSDGLTPLHKLAATTAERDTLAARNRELELQVSAKLHRLRQISSQALDALPANKADLRTALAQACTDACDVALTRHVNEQQMALLNTLAATIKQAFPGPALPSDIERLIQRQFIAPLEAATDTE